MSKTMNKVVIMSGVSGSGKSTLARKMRDDFLITPQNDGSRSCKTVSADTYFLRAGGYRFNLSELGNAHAECFYSFIQAMQNQESYNLIIVDNTNTTVEEISPYILGASAFGYEAELVTVLPSNTTNLERCAARNIHSVSLQSILAQYRRICDRSLPPRWKDRIVFAT